MPGGVRAGQVIGLVEVAGSFGSRMDIAKMADAMGADLAVMLPILDAAQMLGLVRMEKVDLLLTDEGLRFKATSKNKMTQLKAKLAGIEPFRTAMELASKSGGATSQDVASSLSRRGVSWHYDPELNDTLVHALLISWALSSRLLSYDGKTGRFARI
jgi:NitT/TauT family transport system ATP-binding protein